MPRLVAHIGTHKTGTTSIQHHLDTRGGDVAAATGLHHVPLDRLNTPSVRHGLDAPERFRRLGARVNGEWVEALASVGDDVLVADEDLSWVFDPERIGEAASRLRRHFDPVDVVAYVRRQDLHVASHFQQSSHARHPSTVFYVPRPTALPRAQSYHPRYLDHHARLRPWVDALGREHVHVRVFERERLHDGDVVADFLGLVHDLVGGRSLRPPDDEVRKNVSFGKTLTKLGHLSNLLPRRTVWSVRLGAHLPDEGPLVPTQRQARDLLASYDEPNARLGALFGLGEEPFSSRFSQPDTSNVGWEPGEVVAAIAAITAQAQGLLERGRASGTAAQVRGGEGELLLAAARAGDLPDERSCNAVLHLLLARMNALAGRDPDWAQAFGVADWTIRPPSSPPTEATGRAGGPLGLVDRVRRRRRH